MTEEEIGKVLKDRRISIDMSRYRAAKDMDTVAHSIRNIEDMNSSPRLNRLLEYAELLGLEVIVRERKKTKRKK